MGRAYIRAWLSAIIAVPAEGNDGQSRTSAEERSGITACSLHPTAATIDRLINGRLRIVAISAPPIEEDAELLRRVTLDLTGRIPTCDERVEFLASDDFDKRSRHETARDQMSVKLPAAAPRDPDGQR